MELLDDVLSANRYPGRGVLWARTGDGTPVGAYFLTGRTAASRSRTLHRTGAEGELTVAPVAGDADDALRHYVAVRPSGRWIVYGNGEQVATVADRLAAGRLPAQALDDLDYEPDPPIFTPRLTVVAETNGSAAWFGAARHSPGPRTATDRMTLRVGELAPGEAILLTTYHSDAQTVTTGPPFTETRTDAPTPATLLTTLWSALTPELRVAATAFPLSDLPAADLITTPPGEQDQQSA